jgi:hypothetical protein
VFDLNQTKAKLVEEGESVRDSIVFLQSRHLISQDFLGICGVNAGQAALSVASEGWTGDCESAGERLPPE